VKRWVVEVCVNGFGGKLNIAGVKEFPVKWAA